jgi:hypothetical protein
MKIITPFMESLHKELVDTRGVADSTASLYLKNLVQLNGGVAFKNLAFLKQKPTIENRLNEYAESTRRAILGGVVSVLALVKDKAAYKALHRFYSDKLEALSKENRDKDTSEKSEKQEKNWMSWNQILEVKEEYAKKVKDLKGKKQLTAADFDSLLCAVLLGLYTDVPPRRNQDYQLMVVTKKHSDSSAKDVNYLDLTGKKFIYNVYKTAKTHGQQSLAIPEPLLDTIKLYLKHHPGQAGQRDFRFLVYSDGSPLTAVNAMTRIFNRIFGKQVGATMLRHIYLSEKYGKVLEEQKADSEAMGHTLQLQREYIKKDSDSEE